MGVDYEKILNNNAGDIQVKGFTYVNAIEIVEVTDKGENPVVPLDRWGVLTSRKPNQINQIVVVHAPFDSTLDEEQIFTYYISIETNNGDTFVSEVYELSSEDDWHEYTYSAKNNAMEDYSRALLIASQNDRDLFYYIGNLIYLIFSSAIVFWLSLILAWLFKIKPARYVILVHFIVAISIKIFSQMLVAKLPINLFTIIIFLLIVFSWLEYVLVKAFYENSPQKKLNLFIGVVIVINFVTYIFNYLLATYG